MDSRERVSLAIGHCDVDRIPIGEITIADGLIRELLGVGRIAFPERREFVNRLGIDAVCESPEWPTPSLHLPDPEDVRWKDLATWATRSDRFVFAVLDGVFGWGTKLLGFEAFLSASLKRSEALIDLMHGVERLNIALANRAAAAGADGVLIADDIAYQKNTIVGPSVLRELFFPSLRRQLEEIAHLQIPVFFHSDGNLNAVIDDLVDIGFQGLQCLESRAGMDLARLKATYGERTCLWGNLDPTDLFLERDSEELEQGVRDIIEAAAAGGGYIFGTSSGLAEGMRLENLEVVYQAALSF